MRPIGDGFGIARVLHSLGDLTFFTLVWPHDAGRKLISEGGADAGFYANVALLVVVTLLWALAFRQFLKVTEKPASGGAGARSPRCSPRTSSTSTRARPPAV